VAKQSLSNVSNDELAAIIDREVSQSIGHWDGQLAAERTLELDYYNSKPFGNEVDGESQVVSSDVSDTVEGLLPSLLKIFTASDDAVRFDPRGPEDEEGAAQQTETVNYVFYQQNNGFLILYEWFKDALIQKNGVVKYWWEEKIEWIKEEYKGLTEGQYLTLMKGDGDPESIEELEHETYDDPIAAEQKQMVMEKVQNLPPQAQMDPQFAQVQMMLQQPLPQLHNVKVKVRKDKSKVCVQSIPPEEFGVSSKHKCVTLQDAPFAYHRTRMTISDLRASGYDESLISQIGSGSTGNQSEDLSQEALARDRFVDQMFRTDESADDTMREVWVTDAYICLDMDGDGIAELRHVVMAGTVILENEECDHIPFAAITPIIMPHRWVGRSVAELVMDVQLTKSVIWRQTLNNLYLTNNPRKVVLSSASGIVQANLDDLMNSAPGGIVREFVPNAVRDMVVPFVAGASFPMLEYMDAIKENRTGQSRYNQGTDADSLNKTARGISLIQQAGQQRQDLIARIFAETGVKDLMRGIKYMLSKYSTRPMTIRLRNKWVDVDPREWKTEYDMTVSVGLGTGNKDAQLAHLQVMHQQQVELMKTGRSHMVTDENVYNLGKRMAENMGFKHPELFISDPASVQKPQMPPPPEVLKLQLDEKQGQAKLQQAAQMRQFDAQTNKTLEEMRQQTQIAIAQIQEQGKKEIELMRQRHAAEMAVFDSNSKSGEANNALEMKAMQLSQDEQMLALKKEMDRINDNYKNQLQALSDQQKAESEIEKPEAPEKEDSMVQDTLKMLTHGFMEMRDLLSSQIDIAKQTLEAMNKPRSVSIGGIKKDASGQIIGAEIKKEAH
jgi:hypothetical protein